VATIYVNTDVVGGDGNGTSLANAYSSLFAAEAGVGIIAEDSTILCYATASTVDTTAVIINGVADGAYVLTIKRGDSNYISRVSNATALMIQDDMIHVEDMIIEVASMSANYQNPITIDSIKTGTVSLEIQQCELIGANDGTYRQMGIRVNDADADVSIHDNIIRNISTSQGHGLTSGVVVTLGTATLYNNTIEGGTYNINNAGTCAATNNVLYNAATAASLGTVTGGYNGTDYAAAPGSNNQVSINFAGYFVSGTDLHITGSAADLLDNGVGPGSDANVSTTDIDGDTRSGATCDIGADEYVAAGGTTHQLSGSADSVSLLSGAIDQDIKLIGSSDSVSLLSGAINRAMQLSGSTDSVSLLVGAIGVTRQLVGSTDSVSLLTGAINRTLKLSGSVDSVSLLSGNVHIIPGGGTTHQVNLTQRLKGSADSSSLLSGSIALDIKVSGSADSITLLNGTLSFIGDMVWVTAIVVTEYIATDAQITELVEAPVSAQDYIEQNIVVEESI